MSDKPMTPSEQAANALSEYFALDGVEDPLELAAEIIARETGCDLPEKCSLYELLCVIHGDGGRYIAEHGAAKAWADAIEKGQANAEIVRRLVEWCKAGDLGALRRDFPVLAVLVTDAAALHAAGGKDNGTD